jgi:hypothetical protein
MDKPFVVPVLNAEFEPAPPSIWPGFIPGFIAVVIIIGVVLLTK